MTEPAPRDPASPDGAPAPGTVLAGKYVVESVLGQGGMGIVLQARHQRTEQAVAIKLLRPDARVLPDVTARFEREARAAARIQGPHVVRVYDVDNLPDGSPMMVMELLQGWDLGQELAIRGPLPYPEAVGYVLAACEALSQAHRMGVVHRDIKPGNLFLCQEGQRRIVKVLDFGISKVLDKRDNAAQTATTAAFGTPQYMSPEQVRSAKNVDGRADIWSLGVVLYELLGGRGPFDEVSATAALAAIIADDPRPLREVRPDLPQKLADVVMKALEKRADERWPDIDTFMAALMPFGPAGAAPQTLLNAKTPQLAAPREPMSTRRLMIVSAGIAAVVVGVFLFVLASQTKKPAEPAVDTAVTTATTLPPAATPAPSPTMTPTPAATPAAAIETATAPPTAPVAVGLSPKQAPTPASPPVTATATAAPTPKPTPPKPPPPPAEDPTHL
ncbi:serine/threonine-protein kinase [Polyangium jinanense]|uniref:Serine/threonine protein kinase n=1 Tax=Polyangium jinanense TaxID=2829994 RepID=A0A9X3XA26_9BACT|nr:serine/threonine-protein kinase [Polyangium jinanense]MDC3960217.1 serine/threonine protein kinase [Polyangium jinanense]MDC3984933.1 serine/threonine protein kinase [Polyangium jinanense]